MNDPKRYIFEKNGERYEVYWITRNGYHIDHVDLEVISEDFLGKVLEKLPDIDVIQVQGELMPWSLLSRGLIDNHFLPIAVGMSMELDMKGADRFYEKFSLLHAEAEEAKQDLARMTKKDVKEKYGESKALWLQNALTSSKYLLDRDIERASLESYCNELRAYDKATNPSFKPFQVLKIVIGNEEQVLPFDNSIGFSMFNDDDYAIYNTSTDLNDAIEKSKEWSDNPTAFGSDRLEGVVIKPYHLDSEGAPYIKVRNINYLRLVYGPTYDSEPKYSKLLSSKRVGRKTKLSIEQWSLGVKMLRVPYSSINKENKEMREMMMEFVGVEQQVTVLDPRL